MVSGPWKISEHGMTPRRPKRGRPRKYQTKQIVWQKAVESYGVIVDYMQDASGHGYYRCVNIHRLNGGRMYGGAHWRQSWELEPTGMTYKRGPGTYRKNLLLGDRGCSCNCCVHEAIPLGDMRPDGTYIWEAPDE